MKHILDELYPVHKAAEYLGKSIPWIKKYRHVKGFLLNRTRIYLKRELDAYLDNEIYDPEVLFDEEHPELEGYEAYIRSQIFDTRAACEYLDISRRTLKRAESEGRLEGHLLHDRQVIYLKDELDAYEAPKQGAPFQPDAKWHGFHEKYKKKEGE